MKKNIGIDFDNTIVNYDNLLVDVAKMLYSPLPKNFSNKKDIKQYIIKKYSEKKWTDLQGLIYGPLINGAKINLNFKKFVSMYNKSHNIFIISHKTRKSFCSHKFNLRESAINFLEFHDFLNVKSPHLIPSKNIYFESTIEKKLKRIEKLKCDYFIDDMSLILDNIKNKNITKIKFDKQNIFFKFSKNNYSINNWNKIINIIKH